MQFISCKSHWKTLKKDIHADSAALKVENNNQVKIMITQLSLADEYISLLKKKCYFIAIENLSFRSNEFLEKNFRDNVG